MGGGDILTVVIPTYRRPEGLRRFLRLLVDQVRGMEDVDVVVVNDGSHDRAYEAVVDEFASRIRYMVLPRNRGPAAARNEGARASSSRYIVFTDDDCTPPPHWLEWLQSLIDAHPNAAMIGGTTRLSAEAGDGAVEQFNRAFSLYPRPLYLNGELFCMPSANITVRRDWFDRVGGFDERFLYAAGEDVNFAYRLKCAGGNLVVDESWYTEHQAGDTLRGFYKRWYRYGFGTQQHRQLTDDPFDFGIFEDMSNWKLALWTPSYVRYMRTVHRRGQNVFWAIPTSQPWRPVAFAVLSVAQGLAYQLGARRCRRHPEEARRAAPPPDRSSGPSGGARRAVPANSRRATTSAIRDESSLQQN